MMIKKFIVCIISLSMVSCTAIVKIHRIDKVQQCKDFGGKLTKDKKFCVIDMYFTRIPVDGGY